MSLESVNRLVELTGRTNRTIKDRLKAITPIREGRANLYESLDALPLIYDLGERSNPQDEMARLNRVRADKIEFDLEFARGETASVEMLTYALGSAASQINSALDSLPARLKSRNTKLKAKDLMVVNEVVVKLQKQISEIKLDEDDEDEA